MQLSHDQVEPDGSETQEPSGARRNLLKLAAGAAGGVAIAAATAGRAGAATGDPILIGTNNTATTLTRADITGNVTGAAFLFQSGETFAPSGVGSPCALAGLTTTPERPTGVYAWTDQLSGYGVVAFSVNTIGLRAHGARAALKLDGVGIPAPDRTDGHEAGELIPFDHPRASVRLAHRRDSWEWVLLAGHEQAGVREGRPRRHHG
jgi:hypothetical protein